jgi:hypothetical protein
MKGSEKITEWIRAAIGLLLSEWISEEMTKDGPAALDGFDGSDIDHAVTNFIRQFTEIGRNHQGLGFHIGHALGLELIFETTSPQEPGY